MIADTMMIITMAVPRHRRKLEIRFLFMLSPLR
jgi:hypothetical protein